MKLKYGYFLAFVVSSLTTRVSALGFISNINDEISIDVPCFIIYTSIVILILILIGLGTYSWNIRKKCKSDLQDKEEIKRLVDQIDVQNGLDPLTCKVIQINLRKLERYYNLIETHTDKSFLITMVAGLFGFILILIGLAFGYFTPNNQLIVFLASGSGIITESIAGIFFYLYSNTTKQLKECHDCVSEVHNIILSYRILQDITDESTKANLIDKMITAFIDKPH